MSNATPSRIGQINAAGSATALFLKVFPGEVLTAFDETNVTMGRVLVRSISSGKSAQFPATWKATAAYHTPGTQLLGTNLFKQAEREIFIDPLLTSDSFLSNFDEAMSHFDVRGEYAKQHGAALARTLDRRALQVMVLAARASATITGANGGGVVTAATAKTDGSVLSGAIYDGAQVLDEKDVPDSERACYVKPAQYWLLVEVDKLINRDFNGGNGDFAKGKVFNAAGIEIVKTNNLPTTSIAADPSDVNTYAGDFSVTAAVITHRTAIGTVKLMDLAVEKEYQVSRQGTLVVAKMATGTGILRPEASVEIRTGAPA